MITGAFFTIFFALINVILNILPTATMPSGVDSSLSWLFTSVSPFNFIIPFTTLFYLVGIVLMIEAFILSFKMSDWVMNKIRGSGS